MCVCRRSCLPEGTKGAGLKCQDPDTPNTQTKKYMCGLRKHEKKTTRQRLTDSTLCKKYTHANTQRHMFTYESINTISKFETKVFLLQPPSASVPAEDHQVGSTCPSSWVDLLRHNPSSGVFSYLTLVHVCLTDLRYLCDTYMHQDVVLIFFFFFF